jgi:AraC family transcriptional regulator of arabinose operon
MCSRPSYSSQVLTQGKLGQCCRYGRTTPQDKRVQQAVDLFDSLCVTTVAEIAAELNISPSRFRHLFKQELGMSPGCYLRLVRLDRAKRLLKGTFLSVKEITAQIGVNDVSHFVRDYKLRYGHTPSEERTGGTNVPLQLSA